MVFLPKLRIQVPLINILMYNSGLKGGKFFDPLKTRLFSGSGYPLADPASSTRA